MHTIDTPDRADDDAGMLADLARIAYVMVAALVPLVAWAAATQPTGDARVVVVLLLVPTALAALFLRRRTMRLCVIAFGLLVLVCNVPPVFGFGAPLGSGAVAAVALTVGVVWWAFTLGPIVRDSLPERGHDDTRERGDDDPEPTDRDDVEEPTAIRQVGDSVYVEQRSSVVKMRPNWDRYAGLSEVLNARPPSLPERLLAALPPRRQKDGSATRVADLADVAGMDEQEFREALDDAGVPVQTDRSVRPLPPREGVASAVPSVLTGDLRTWAEEVEDATGAATSTATG